MGNSFKPQSTGDEEHKEIIQDTKPKPKELIEEFEEPVGEETHPEPKVYKLPIPFPEFCHKLHLALQSDKGKKLNCRVKVLVTDSQAMIYQGVYSNVWGRFNVSGIHNIYRHQLKNLLKTNPDTAEFFTDLV